MSTTQRLYSKAFAFLDSDNRGSNVHTGSQVTLRTYESRLLVKFESLPDQFRFKRISGAQLFFYFLATEGSYDWYDAHANTKEFDEKTATWDTWNETGYNLVFQRKGVGNAPVWAEFPSASILFGDAVTYGIRLQSSLLNAKPFTVQTSGANRPYLVLTIDESATADTLNISSMSPNAGAIDKYRDVLFTWSSTAPYPCAPRLVQASATFQWRTGPSETIHSHSVSGNTSSFTVQAGTFTGTSIQWRIVVTANSGKTTTSDWVTLSTADAESTAAIKSPKGEIVDVSRPVAFAWTHIISTGTAQTKAELQISTDMQTWTALATVTGAETTYTAPANTLGSGTKYWRVRTYNTDNAAGAWSDAAEFICVGAPAAPAVSIKSQSPRPVIGWQSSEQLAYQVEIDGVYSSGTYYGTEKTWTAPMYLEDGEYIVRVRVQNEYAMWSPWGSAALQVANTAGPAINLTAEAGDTVRLSWSAAGGYHYNFYLIYRDGKLIAKTTEHTYTDLRSIGSVSYQVRGCFDTSSNYRLSNTVEVTASVPCVTLIDLDTGDVLPLPYSASTHRTTGRNLSRGVQSVQLAGRRYPTIERSMHYAETISVACAFREAEDCAALEALVGKMVAVKTPEGKMVSGCLSVLAATADGGFYTTYQFDVEQADVEEVVDIDS